MNFKLLFLTLFIPFFTFTQNLIINGGFEQGTLNSCDCAVGFDCMNDAGRVSNGIHPLYGPIAEGCIDGSTNYTSPLGAHCGIGCMYFYAGADSFVTSNSINVSNGGLKEFCIWYCGPQGVGGMQQNTGLAYFSFLLDGVRVGANVFVPTNTPWTKYCVSINVTSGMHNFGVLSGGAGKYSIWFDDFSVAEPCGNIKANAGINDTINCLNLSVNIGDTLSSNICDGQILYEWTPSIGLSDPNVSNPIATPLVTTSYVLTVSDGNNCIDSDEIEIIVDNEEPIAIAGPDIQITNCFSSSEILDASNSIGEIINYKWIGNGLLGNGSNILDSTKNVGLIILEVEANNFCLGYDSLIVSYNLTYPTASFLVNNTCLNNTTFFYENSTILSGEIVSWEWSFGDNSLLNSNQNPSHLYSLPGEYFSTLIVTSDSGCVDTLISSLEIHPLPFVSFNPEPSCLYDSVFFDNLSFLDTIGTTIYIWGFGDNSNFSSEVNPSHLYEDPGIYDVSLIVSSSNGCINDTTLQVSVYPIPNATFSNSTICQNEGATDFINTSSINTGSIVDFSWSFGDQSNGISTLPSPSYVFGDSGVYEVVLIVVSDNNCADSISNLVIVNPTPNALFEVDILEGCSPLCVNFTDLSLPNTLSIDKWNWKLDDLEFNDQQYPNYCYYNLGDDSLYSVTLIVENNLGCIDTITKNDFIKVWAKPYSKFSILDDNLDMFSLNLGIENSSEHGDVYYWNFYDGNTSNLFEPDYMFRDTGRHSIELIVESVNDCLDTSYNSVYIKPLISFYVPNSFTPNGDGVNDDFFFKGYGITERNFLFSIYNRWGELIYETDKFIPWDGNFNREGSQDGVYVWKLNYIDIFGENNKKIGNVTLLR